MRTVLENSSVQHSNAGLAKRLRSVGNTLVLGLISLTVIACGSDSGVDADLPQSQPETQTERAQPANVEIDVASAPQNADAGEWLLHGHSHGEQRFSPLDQINAENVSELGLAFEYTDFIVRGRTNRGVEASTLMDDGVLYFTGPWSVVYAVDARTGEEEWVYDPEAEGARARVTCCDVVNRGVALRGDKVFVGTVDGYLVALDKATGAEVWKVDTLTDRAASYSITGAPRLTNNLVVIGNGGAEMGVRGYVTAYDVETGEQAWRFFTVPSAGPDETPDITRARDTWTDEMPWEYGGGGTVWDSMVYDETLGTLYIGTGNGSPWASWDRGGGDNLYLSSIVALDAETGRVKWHYQTTPGDSWDYTATQHMILADIEWKGEARQVIMQAPKNGFFYVLDRVTGELLSAKPFAPVTWASHVDMETGRPVLTENADFSNEDRVISPSAGGAHNWPPMAFNGETGLVYIPAIYLANRYSEYDDKQGYTKLSRNTLSEVLIANPVRDADLLEGLPPLRYDSRVVAWDPQAEEARWISDAQNLGSGGILTTAGNLVVEGSTDGHVYFFNAESGELLRKINVGTTTFAPPITYELDGEQYLAVLAGHGGVGLFAYGPGNAAANYQNFERLLVYKLGGGETPLPPKLAPKEMQPIAEGLPSDPGTIPRGAAKYRRFCVQCHTERNTPSGIPDLWNMPASVHESFDKIVLDGALSYAGMAGFSDVLTAEDTLAIRAYIADDRRRMAAGDDAVDVRGH